MKSALRLRRLLTILFILSLILPCYGQSGSSLSAELTDTAAINKTIKYTGEIIKKDQKEALSLSLKIIEASEKLNYTQGILDGTYMYAYLLKRNRKFDSAKRMYKKCIDLIEKNNDLNYSYSVYGNLGNIYSSQAQYDSALFYLKFTRDHSLKEGDTTNFIIASNNLSINYRYLGMWDSSLAILKENEKIIRLINDTVRLATCYQLQGTILQAQGNVKAALEYYFKALNLEKQVNKLSLIYLTQVEIASLYLELKEYQQAIDLLTSIKKGYETEVQGNTTLYNTLGDAYQGIGNFDSAYFYYQKSVDECLSNNQPGKAAMAYRFLGDLLNEEGKYAEAYDYLKKGLEVCDEKEMKQQYAITSNSLGISCLNLGKLSDAGNYFAQAMDIGNDLNDIAVLRDAANGLQQVNAAKGNYKTAYLFMSQYKQYSDSLLNAGNIRAITTKDLEYEFNNEKTSMLQHQEQERLLHQESLKRQKIIRNTIFIICVLLILISVVLYRIYRVKKKADNEKAALMKEIHHRVKNNLQIISSLLNIQTEYLKDASVIGAIQESQSRVKAMALIHQLLYQEGNFTRIDFEMYLKQLVTALSGIFKKPGTEVSTEIQAEQVFLDIDTSIPLGLIVTELVSNAYKYAFNESKRGMIKIKVRRNEDNTYELAVSDNGKGLPESFSIDNASSMGLKLVKILSEQLDARLSYFNDKGTNFRLVFGEK